MTPVPFELPLRPNEAAAIADLMFQQLDGRPLSEDQRGRFAGRLDALDTPTIAAYAASLTADPVHASTYYMAVDGHHHGVVTPLLLRVAPSSAAATGVFPKSLMIGRVRPLGQREVVISAVPFGPGDHDHIRAFAEQIDKSFLPRSHGAQPTVISRTAGAAAAFEQFRQLPRQTLVTIETGEFWSAVWAAIRAGRRDGYSVGTVIDTAAGVEAALRQAEESPFFTRYVIRCGAKIEDAMAVMDHVRRVKAGLSHLYTRTVDFELAVAEAHELAPALAALKAEGRAVQAVSAANMESPEAVWDEIRAWNVPLVLDGPAPAGVRASWRTQS